MPTTSRRQDLWPIHDEIRLNNYDTQGKEEAMSETKKKVYVETTVVSDVTALSSFCVMLAQNIEEEKD